ncbi:hypothetical protein KA005_84235 [bacterium]|nr:hypothetical protein [bacterium]
MSLIECDRDCSLCPALDTAGGPTGCRIINTQIAAFNAEKQAHEMAKESFEAQRDYWIKRQEEPQY